jgi:hypothetical protein
MPIYHLLYFVFKDLFRKADQLSEPYPSVYFPIFINKPFGAAYDTGYFINGIKHFGLLSGSLRPD